jgi:chromosome segregation ATPase
VKGFEPRRDELDLEFKKRQTMVEEVAAKLGVYNSKIKAKKLEGSRATNEIQGYQQKLKRSDEKRKQTSKRIDAIHEEVIHP